MNKRASYDGVTKFNNSDIRFRRNGQGPEICISDFSSACAVTTYTIVGHVDPLKVLRYSGNGVKRQLIFLANDGMVDLFNNVLGSHYRSRQVTGSKRSLRNIFIKMGVKEWWESFVLSESAIANANTSPVEDFYIEECIRRTLLSSDDEAGETVPSLTPDEPPAIPRIVPDFKTAILTGVSQAFAQVFDGIAGSLTQVFQDQAAAYEADAASLRKRLESLEHLYSDADLSTFAPRLYQTAEEVKKLQTAIGHSNTPVEERIKAVAAGADHSLEGRYIALVETLKAQDANMKQLETKIRQSFGVFNKLKAELANATLTIAKLTKQIEERPKAPSQQKICQELVEEYSHVVRFTFADALADVCQRFCIRHNIDLTARAKRESEATGRKIDEFQMAANLGKLKELCDTVQGLIRLSSS